MGKSKNIRSGSPRYNIMFNAENTETAEIMFTFHCGENVKAGNAVIPDQHSFSER